MSIAGVLLIQRLEGSRFWNADGFGWGCGRRGLGRQENRLAAVVLPLLVIGLSAVRGSDPNTRVAMVFEHALESGWERWCHRCGTAEIGGERNRSSTGLRGSIRTIGPPH
jgi:hypothetical protein